MKKRLFVTALVILFYGVVNNVGNAVGTVVLGNAAGLQFDSNNFSYLTFTGIMSLVTRYNILIDGGLSIILLIIWIPSLVHLFKMATEETSNL